MKIKLYVLALVFFSSFNCLHSQKPDNNYGMDGKQAFQVRNTYVSINTALVVQGEKLVIGGYVYADDDFGGSHLEVWRLDHQGVLDSSFGNVETGTTEIYGSPYSGTERGGTIAIQNDKKIVGIGTDVSNLAFPNAVVVFRLKKDGKLDSSFGTTGKSFFVFNQNSHASAAPTGVTIKKDRKILINGSITLADYSSAELIQVLPNGQLDSSFGINGVLVKKSLHLSKGLTLLTLPDGKILGGFEYVDKSGEVKTCLKQYTADGNPDSSFGNNGLVINPNPHTYPSRISIAIQPDNKIVEYTVGDGSDILLRYNADGSIDNSFGKKGRVNLPFTDVDLIPNLSVAVDDKGGILVTATNFSIQRYFPNGKLDSSFGVDGTLSTDFPDAPDFISQRIRCIALQPNNKILGVGQLNYGYEENDELAIARFNYVASEPVISDSGINAVSTDNESLVVYPNPAKNILNVTGLNNAKQYILIIRDAAGNVVTSERVNSVSSYSINIQNVSNGSYYLQITSTENTKTIKFMKQ